MLSCDNCKLVLEAGTAYCPRCGRKLIAGVAAGRPRHPSDPAVRGLLHEARMLGAKNAWDRAVDRCLEALKADPENPEVYTALGDIYEGQGRIDQALQWYQMAEAEYAGAGEPAPDLRAKIRSLESRRTPAHHTTGWYDRFVATQRFSASVRVVTFAMVGFLALLMLGAVFVICADKVRDRAMENPRSQTSSLDDPSRGDSQPGRASGERALSTGPRVREFASKVMRDATVAGRRIAVTGVSADPHMKQLTIQFTVSPTEGKPSKAHIMADSAAVCAASYALSRGVEMVSVYAFADVSDDTGAAHELERVFYADTTRQSGSSGRPSLPASELRKIFSNVAWDPRIPD